MSSAGSAPPGSNFGSTARRKQAQREEHCAMAGPTLVDQLDHLHEDLRLYIVSVLAHDNPKHLAYLAALSSAWSRLVIEYLRGLNLPSSLLRVVTPGPAEQRRACLSALQCTRALVTVGGYNSGWNSHASCSMADDGPGCERSADIVHLFRGREGDSFGPSVWESAPCDVPALPPTAMRRADLALVSGPQSTLYAVGGREGEAAHASVECLALPRHQLFGEGWTTAAPMAEARVAPLAAFMHNALLVAGGLGSGAGASSRTVECYDTQHNVWSLLPPMHDARSYAGSITLHGKWYALGGRGNTGHPLGAEAFDGGRGAWLRLPVMNHTPRNSVIGAVHRECVLAVSAKVIESYDPREGRWWVSSPANLRSVVGPGWWGGCAHVEGDRLYVMGGSHSYGGPAGVNHRSLDTVWVFDLRRAGSESLLRQERLRVPRWCAAASVVAFAC